MADPVLFTGAANFAGQCRAGTAVWGLFFERRVVDDGTVPERVVAWKRGGGSREEAQSLDSAWRNNVVDFKKSRTTAGRTTRSFGIRMNDSSTCRIWISFWVVVGLSTKMQSLSLSTNFLAIGHPLRSNSK